MKLRYFISYILCFPPSSHRECWRSFQFPSWVFRLKILKIFINSWKRHKNEKCSKNDDRNVKWINPRSDSTFYLHLHPFSSYVIQYADCSQICKINMQNYLWKKIFCFLCFSRNIFFQNYFAKVIEYLSLNIVQDAATIFIRLLAITSTSSNH